MVMIGAIPLDEAVETIKKYVKARKGVELSENIYYFGYQYEMTGHMYRIAKKWLDDNK